MSCVRQALSGSVLLTPAPRAEKIDSAAPAPRGRRDRPVMADPIHQFEINKIFTIGHIGGQEIAFTNSSLYMLIAVGVIGALLIGTTASRSIVPGRLQS